MPVSVIKYRKWKLMVDREATLAAYQKYTSGAERCNCLLCQNYIANRERVYPNEILMLFHELGIDFRKEFTPEDFEVPKIRGLYTYYTSFQFKGRFINNAKRSSTSKMNRYSTRYTKVNDKFGIAFSDKPWNDDKSITLFDKEEKDLVQVNVCFKTPWTIGEEKENRKIRQDTVGWFSDPLSKTQTGIEVNVYVYPHNAGGGEPHIEVQNNYKEELTIEAESLFKVFINDNPQIENNTGELTPATVGRVVNWVKLNHITLLKLWNQEITDNWGTYDTLIKAENNGET